ncbi:protein kinase, partial [Streptomyces sp. NPDC127092]|uniref:protein kinase domain-containing protein n=1 Tax=Streptomyces sp. NPDC127092 TaxID=3347135 RepID=UPI003655DB3B
MMDPDGSAPIRGAYPTLKAELEAEGFGEVEVIGRGGFGVVFRCREPSLDRVVAVKVLGSGLDEENRARFLREQRAMGQLSDFGIARIEGGFETDSGALTGSPAYTAPEVLSGESPSVASDIYGLGATLFSLITGHAAFERRSGEQIVAQFLRITAEQAPRLPSAGIPADVRAAIETAMARDPGARPCTAA